MSVPPIPSETAGRVSLRRRLLVWLVVLSIVPMVLVAGQGYHCARQAVVEKTRLHLASLLTLYRTLIHNWLQDARTDIDLLASVPCVLGACSGAAIEDVTQHCCNVLEAVVRHAPMYESLASYSRDWRPVVQAGCGAAKAHRFVTPELKAALEGGTGEYLGSAHDHEDGAVGVHLGRRIAGSSGYLVANLDLTRGLAQLLQDRGALGASGKVYLVDHDLHILVNPADPSAPAPDARAAPLISEIAAAKPPAVREYHDHRGVRVLGTAVAVPEAEWLLVAEVDRDEALAWLDELALRALSTGGVMLILIVVVALTLSGRLVEPFRQLAAVARRIRDGHVQERVGPMRDAEAEDVRHAFNQMLDEQAEIQRKLVQSATLASVGELASSIVHEMRNPLSPIKMNLQALRRKVGDDASYAELADIALQQVRRLESMLNDLLQYGKPIALSPAPVPAQDLIDEVFRIVAEPARDAGVRLAADNGLGGRSVRLDREQSCRMLTNLLLNAIQASPHGGTVTVRMDEAGDAPGVIRIEVADEGPGIPQALRERLYAPFVSTRPGGTGLGLANVKKIAELHGGSVSARDRPGGGTIFEVRLPPRGAF